MSEQKILSIIIPLLNEEDNVRALYAELKLVLSKLMHFTSHEFIFVNDGSTDRSLTILKELSLHDSTINIISFTRNFGHEAATFAGLKHCHGDAAVLIDADRQDPADLILAFEKEFLQGYHIVYGQRSKRLNETWLKKITSKAFYPLFKWITGVDMPRDVGDFCLLSRKAIDLIKQFDEKTIFIRGLIYWLGLPKKGVLFVRRSRGGGTSKYNYLKLTVFALENIISFSTVPIYMILFFSLLVIFLCIVGSMTAFIMHCLGYVVMTGWTSLIMCMLFLFATTLFFLGIIGLYVGKVFQEIKARPVFIVDELVGFGSNKYQSKEVLDSDYVQVAMSGRQVSPLIGKNEQAQCLTKKCLKNSDLLK